MLGNFKIRSYTKPEILRKPRENLKIPHFIGIKLDVRELSNKKVRKLCKNPERRKCTKYYR